MVIKFILVFTFRLFVMIDQDSGSCFEIKQECKDDLLEIVDNLKQEETEEQSKEALCSSSKDTDSMQKETKCENFIIVSNDAESTYTNIKQECDEEDPLNIADDFVQTTETSEYTGTLSTNIAKVYIKTLSINTFVLSVKNNSLLIWV